MSNPGLFVESLLAGIGLGVMCFGGLWWTVRLGLAATTPAVWFAVSVLLRTALTVYGLYCFARQGLPSLLACLAGLLIARAAVKHLTRITC